MNSYLRSLVCVEVVKFKYLWGKHEKRESDCM